MIINQLEGITIFNYDTYEKIFVTIVSGISVRQSIHCDLFLQQSTGFMLIKMNRMRTNSLILSITLPLSQLIGCKSRFV